jgi:hypothetical protein
MMPCQHCRPGGEPRSAAGRCQFCALSLCSEHLGQALRPAPPAERAGCGHLFVAAGWLAEALGRVVPPASAGRAAEVAGR